MSPLSSHERAQLRSQAQRLKPVISVGNAGITDGLLAQTRTSLMQYGLIKVRIQTDDRDEARAAAEELASRVPCHLVARLGFVAVLHAPPGSVYPDGGDESHDSDAEHDDTE